MRLYGIVLGEHDAHVVYVQADCPNEAVTKLVQSDYISYSETATICETEFNKYDMLVTTTELCKVALVGSKGYLWDGDRFAGQDRCRLCGGGPGADEKDFLNSERKCGDCAILREIRAH